MLKRVNVVDLAHSIDRDGVRKRRSMINMEANDFQKRLNRLSLPNLPTPIESNLPKWVCKRDVGGSCRRDPVEMAERILDEVDQRLGRALPDEEVDSIREKYQGAEDPLKQQGADRRSELELVKTMDAFLNQKFVSVAGQSPADDSKLQKNMMVKLLELVTSRNSEIKTVDAAIDAAMQVYIDAGFGEEIEEIKASIRESDEFKTIIESMGSPEGLHEASEALKLSVAFRENAVDRWLYKQGYVDSPKMQKVRQFGKNLSQKPWFGKAQMGVGAGMGMFGLGQSTVSLHNLNQFRDSLSPEAYAMGMTGVAFGYTGSIYGLSRMAHGLVSQAAGFSDEGLGLIGAGIRNAPRLVGKNAAKMSAKTTARLARFAPIAGSIIAVSAGIFSLTSNAMAADEARKAGNVDQLAFFAVNAVLDSIGIVLDVASAVCEASVILAPVGFVLDVIATFLGLCQMIIGFFAPPTNARQDFDALIKSQAFTDFIDKLAADAAEEGYSRFAWREGANQYLKDRFKQYKEDLSRVQHEVLRELQGKRDKGIKVWDMDMWSETLVDATTDKDDYVVAKGEKSVFGLGGDDQILRDMHKGASYGGAGDDRIIGGVYQEGNAGKDKLIHGLGSVTQKGGSGDDEIRPGTGFADIDGGPDVDTLLLPSPPLENQFGGVSTSHFLQVKGYEHDPGFFYKMQWRVNDWDTTRVYSPLVSANVRMKLLDSVALAASSSAVLNSSSSALPVTVSTQAPPGFPYVFKVDLSQQRFSNSFIGLSQYYQQHFQDDFTVLKSLYGIERGGSLRILNSGMNFINYYNDPSAFLFSPHSDLEACEGKTDYTRSKRYCPDNTDVVPSASIQKFPSETIALNRVSSSNFYKIGEVTLGRLRRAFVRHTRAGNYRALYSELMSGDIDEYTWVRGGSKIRNAHAITVDKYRLHSSTRILKFDARGRIEWGSHFEFASGCKLLSRGTRCWGPVTTRGTKEDCCPRYEVLGVDFIPEAEVYQGQLFIDTKGFEPGGDRQITMYFVGNEGTVIKFDYQQLLKWANIKTWYDKSKGQRYTHENNQVVRFYASLMDMVGSYGSVRNIENVVGSQYSTELIGDDQNNLLIGRSGRNYFAAGGGNDQIVTGIEQDIVEAGPGNDSVMIKETGKGRKYVDGGEGYDRVSYAGSEQGVDVDLSRTRQDLDQGDAFVGVEAFELTPYYDKFVGNDDGQTVWPAKGKNHLWMRGGDDTVICDGGHTVLRLEKGSNKVFLKSGTHVVHGGTGDDQILFSGPSHTVHFIDGGGGSNQLVSSDRPDIFLRLERFTGVSSFNTIPLLKGVYDSVSPANPKKACEKFRPDIIKIDLSNNQLKFHVPGLYDPHYVNVEPGPNKGKRGKFLVEDYKFSEKSGYRMSFQVEGLPEKIERNIKVSELGKGEVTLTWSSLVGTSVPLDLSLKDIVNQVIVEVDVQWGPMYDTTIKCFNGNRLVRETPGKNLNKDNIRCNAGERRVEAVRTSYQMQCQSQWQSSYWYHTDPAAAIDLGAERKGKRRVKGIRVLKTQDGNDYLIGSPNENNILMAGNGDNSLMDMGGDNQFSTGMGSNVVTAGKGYDTLLYPTVTLAWLKESPFAPYTRHRISVNRPAGFVTHTWKTKDGLVPEKTFEDSFTGIDHIVGTGNADRYQGSSADEHYTTGGGNDWVDMGEGSDMVVVLQQRLPPASNDQKGVPEPLQLQQLDGGSSEGSSDTVIFETLEGVWIDLSAKQARVGQGVTFPLLNFERITGSHWKDVLYGNDENDVFAPREGDEDEAYGRGGDDTFFLSQGTHLISGGAGSDTVDYSVHVLPEGSRGIMMFPDPEQLKTMPWLATHHWFQDISSFEQGESADQCPDNDGREGSCRVAYVLYRQFTPAVSLSVKDRLYGVENILATAGDDLIFLTVSSGVVNGFQGNDQLVDLSEGGVLIGGEGVDHLYACHMEGCKGSITQGGSGEDTHYGGPGDDKMIADQGADVMRGEAGKDIYVVYSSAKGSRVIDPDYENMLVFKEENIASSDFSLQLNVDYSELAITYRGDEWVTIELEAVERRVRPDGSLDTEHFVGQLYRHFSYIQLVNTNPPGRTAMEGTNPLPAEPPFTKEKLKVFYHDLLTRDLRLDNIMVATPEKPVIRSGLGNDDLWVKGSVVNHYKSVVYELRGEQGHDSFTVEDSDAEVYPGDGHNSLSLGSEGKAFVHFDETRAQSFKLSLPFPPLELRSQRWLPVGGTLRRLPAHGNPGRAVNHGGFDQAVLLADRNQWLEYPGLITGGAMMVSLWVKIAGLSEGDLPIFCFSEQEDLHTIEATKTGNGDLTLSFSGAPSEALFRKTLSGFFQNKAWVHVALVVSNGEDVGIYKNGESVSDPFRVPTLKRMPRLQNYLGRSATRSGVEPVESREQLYLDSLIVTDQIPSRERLKQLVHSESGALWVISSECGEAQAVLTGCPDYLELQESWYLDGKPAVQTWLDSTPLTSLPRPDGRHIFVADHRSVTGLFPQGDGWKIVDKAPGKADLLVVESNWDNQVLFRKYGNDLIIYRFRDGENYQTVPLANIVDRRKYNQFFAQNSIESVERIQVNQRVVPVDDIWSLTQAFPDPDILLKGVRLEDIRVIEEGGRLLLFLKGGELSKTMTLEQLWPLEWAYQSLESEQQSTIQVMVTGEVGEQALALVCSLMDWRGMGRAWRQFLQSQGTTWSEESGLLSLNAREVFEQTSNIQALPSSAEKALGAALWLGTGSDDAWGTQGGAGAFLGLAGEDRFIVRDVNWGYLSGGEGEDTLEFAHKKPLGNLLVDGAKRQVLIDQQDKGLFSSFENLEWNSPHPGSVISAPDLSRIVVRNGRLDVVAGKGLTHIVVQEQGLLNLENPGFESVIVSCNDQAKGFDSLRFGSPYRKASDIMVERFEPVTQLEGVRSGGPMTLACFLLFASEPLGSVTLFEFSGSAQQGSLSITTDSSLNLLIRLVQPDGTEAEQVVNGFFELNHKCHMVVTLSDGKGSVYRDGKHVRRFLSPFLPEGVRTASQAGKRSGVTMSGLVFANRSTSSRTARLLADNPSGKMLRFKHQHTGGHGVVVYGEGPERISISGQIYSLTDFFAQSADFHESDEFYPWIWPDPDKLNTDDTPSTTAEPPVSTLPVVPTTGGEGVNMTEASVPVESKIESATQDHMWFNFPNLPVTIIKQERPELPVIPEFQSLVSRAVAIHTRVFRPESWQPLSHLPCYVQKELKRDRVDLPAQTTEQSTQAAYVNNSDTSIPELQVFPKGVFSDLESAVQCDGSGAFLYALQPQFASTLATVAVRQISLGKQNQSTVEGLSCYGSCSEPEPESGQAGNDAESLLSQTGLKCIYPCSETYSMGGDGNIKRQLQQSFSRKSLHCGFPCSAHDLSIEDSDEGSFQNVSVDLELQKITSGQAYQWFLEGTENFRWNNEGSVILKGNPAKNIFELGELAGDGQVRSGFGDDDILHSSPGTLTYQYEKQGGEDFIQVLGEGGVVVDLGDKVSCAGVILSEMNGLIKFGVTEGEKQPFDYFYLAGKFDSDSGFFERANVSDIRCGEQVSQNQHSLDVLIQSINQFKGFSSPSSSVFSNSSAVGSGAFTPTTTFAGG